MVKRISILTLIVIGIIIAACKKDEFKDLDCSTIDSKYSTSISGIISSKCNTSGCHNAGSSKGDFTSYAKVKPYVDNGSFNKEVIVNKSMPKGTSLSQDERNKIKCWLDAGGPNN